MPAAPLPLPDARALASALGAAARMPGETVGISDAVGRVLAADVVAPDRLPRFDASAMDGFAVRAADTADAAPDRPVLLRLAAEARAGQASPVSVAAGTAARISTGAPLPSGADAVVRIEDASVVEGAATVRRAVAPGHDVRRAGEDVAVGAAVLAAGCRVHPGAAALLAGLGVSSVLVARRPSVLVVVTGDEVAATGTPAAEAMVRDVNGVAIPALLRSMAGVEDVRTVRVGDDLPATVSALGAVDADVVVTCGGLSVGRHDHVRRALADVGAEERMGRVAMKPGAPTWLGTLPGDPHPRPVLGLPGNPGAAIVAAVVLGRPLLEALAGAPPVPRAWARLREPTPRDAARHRVLWASCVRGDDGTLAVGPLEHQQAHRLRPAADADTLAIVPPGSGPATPGTVVEIVPVPGVHD